MSQNEPGNRPHHSSAWRHPLFWKMLAADGLLIGFTAIIFPAETGVRLGLMVLAILLASLVLNIVLTPPTFRPLPGIQPEDGPSSSASGPAGVTTENGSDRTEADRVRSLSMMRRSLQAHETERAAIAKELRDRAAQHLTALTLQLSAALERNRDRETAGPLTAARDIAAGAACEIAEMAERIYPAWRGEFGLVSALDALRHRVAERGALDVKVAVHGEPFDVPLPVVRALLRVAEEAVENVEHHVGAGTVSVDLTFANPAVRLEIADPAGGFDVSVLKRSDGGLGLFRARELLAQEGGQVQIDSAPGRGTRVRAVVDALHGAAT